MIPDSTGTYFGELEFLGLSDERSNDIKAKVYCELSALHPKDVEDIIKQSAQLQERLHKYVELKTRLATLAYATNATNARSNARSRQSTLGTQHPGCTATVACCCTALPLHR
jgi:CRP-like cAMP-binding protein